jgi:uncharacterized protein Yka (UPF0111/DUF47 family)
MALFTRTTKNLILKIDEFFDNIDLGLLVFREGIKSYVAGDMDAYYRHLYKVDSLEGMADKLQREIENDMITHSILPQHMSDVLQLIEQCDEIMDALKSTLYEFDIEIPDIPKNLSNDIITLSEASANAAEELIPAARAYFRSPHNVREKLLKVYYFESETDKIAFDIKKKIAHKAHLRYIIHHIESISDLAQKGADRLSNMSIKIVM